MQQIEAAAEELIAQAVAAGRFDPVTQEPMICRFLTAAEDQSMADKGSWQPQWEKREPVSKPPMVESSVVEPPEPAKPIKIHYPEGLVPY
jgi:hypothetical protein